MNIYKHWRLETDSDQILWIYFDKQNANVNSIDYDVMEEFSKIIETLSKDKQHKGMIIASAKKSGFIAGADISKFSQFKDVYEATALLKMGQQIFDQLEALKIPSVAMIEGFCLGGGLELALTCHYRVVEESEKTRLGLPEVKLGIHPGWGGTVRLPRLIGGARAMDLILTGRTVSGKTAAKIGIADVSVPKRELKRAAKFYALKHPKRHRASYLHAITNLKPVRAILTKIMRKKLREKISAAHYPAPFKVLENWEQVSVWNTKAEEREAETCGKLFLTDTSQNLVRVFFLQEKLKGLAKEAKFSFQHVHVIGAGTMGGDIAAWCALRGFHVTLQDRDPKFIAPAIQRAYLLFKEKLKEPYLIQRAMDLLMPDVDGSGISKADVIIEAIFENLAAKQDLFKLLESKAKPDAILATNTSSIPLDEINSVMQHPERLVGIHFFNPVAKMQLIEIVQSARVDLNTIQKAISFVRQIDKLPLPVKSSPGFLVNRILMPYLLESVAMLDENIPANMIDKAMTEFGMPMGPVALADTVGLDICFSVANYLSPFLKTSVPQKLIDLVNQKKLGRKTGEGFYKYKNGKIISSEKNSYDEKELKNISDRLVKRMIDESFACLKEGVVSDGDLLDAGMVYGTGFAPFRGGPIHYANAEQITASTSS